MDVTANDINSVIVSINQLKLGAMVFLALVISAGLAGYWMWLRQRADDARQRAAAAQLEADAAAEDRKAKNERGRRLTESLDGLTRAFSAHERWESTRFDSLAAAQAATSASFTSTSREHTDRIERSQLESATKISDTLSSLGEVLREISDRQRGVMNSTDTLRLIEQTLERLVLVEFVRICEASIRTNDYASRKGFIHDKVTVAMNGVLDTALKSLRSYPLILDPAVFFAITTETGVSFPGRPGAEGGEFQLVRDAWEVLRTLHESKIAETRPAKDQAVEACSLRLTRLVHQAFYAGRARALDIYGDGTGRYQKQHSSGEFTPVEPNQMPPSRT